MKLDYFLYSCFEFEQTCKAFPAKALGPQRWPEILQFLDGHRESFRDLGNFKDQVKVCMCWYVEQFPGIENDRKLEMENISAIAAATAYFCLDLKILASNDPDNLMETMSSSESNSVWDEVDQIINASIPHLNSYVKAYLRWVFVQREEQVWEAGSRPPVGRFAPGAARRAARPGGDRSGPPRRGGGDRNGPRGDRGGRPDRGDRGNQRGDRGERGERGDRRPRSAAAARGGSHAEQEKQAMESVTQAVERLRSEPDLNEIRLDPSNSFFRRLQHKKAVSEGFFSFSTGEGMTRAVVVTRDRPAEEEDAQ